MEEKEVKEMFDGFMNEMKAICLEDMKDEYFMNI
jgi:hypothetical protein